MKNIFIRKYQKFLERIIETFFLILETVRAMQFSPSRQRSTTESLEKWTGEVLATGILLHLVNYPNLSLAKIMISRMFLQIYLECLIELSSVCTGSYRYVQMLVANRRVKVTLTDPPRITANERFSYSVVCLCMSVLP